MTFECIGCGLCCTNMAAILASDPPFDWMASAHESFPYGTKDNGHCEKLVDNKCSVYEDRPLLCDIGRMTNELESGMTQAQWFEMNGHGCNYLLTKAGMSERVRTDYVTMEIR